MVRPRRSSAASDESGGTAGNQVCFSLDGGGVNEGSGLIWDRNWGACMIILQKSSCWVQVGVESKLHSFTSLSGVCAD
jgi:hypothetical protein